MGIQMSFRFPEIHWTVSELTHYVRDLFENDHQMHDGYMMDAYWLGFGWSLDGLGVHHGCMMDARWMYDGCIMDA